MAEHYCFQKKKFNYSNKPKGGGKEPQKSAIPLLNNSLAIRCEGRRRSSSILERK